ncbi:MAG: TonB-dependent receptor [Pseudomonadota bacterium]
MTVDLVYTWEDNADSGTSFKNGLFAPTGGDTSPFSFVEMSGSPLSREALGAAQLGIDREVEDLNLRVEWQINDSLTFTSITAGRSFESLEVFDADGTQAWFLEFAENAEGDQFSQEFRLVGETENLTYILGANYFEEDGSQRVPFSTEESVYLNCIGILGSGLPCVNPDGSVPVLTPVLTGGAVDLLPYQSSFANFGENETLSVFADGTWRLTDRLEATVGVRYVTEDRTSGFSAVSPIATLAPIALLPVIDTGGEILEASADFDDWLPRFNLLYTVSSSLNTYATISKGRRSDVIDVTSGIGPDGVVAEITEIPAEIVWNYEAGVKGTAADGRVSYGASVFYQDYSDFQVTLQDEAGNFFTANAGAATNTGFEADVRALIGDSWDVFANLAYIDAEIDDDSSNGNLAGNRFRLQPEWTASTGVRYLQPISGALSLTGSLVYSYRSDVFFEPENAPISGLDIAEDAYGLLNLRLGVENDTHGWRVEAFATNLLDEEYLVDAGNTGGSFGNPTFVAGPPVFYGVQVDFFFGP